MWTRLLVKKQLLLTCPKSLVAQLSQYSTCPVSPSSSSSNELIPIYRFPFVVVGAVVNKIKKIQLVGVSLAVPGSLAAYAMEMCPPELPISVGTVGVASTVAIFSVGQLFSRLIGQVYVTEDLRDVKVSYIDFWGSRQDVMIPQEDLLPLRKTPNYMTDFLYKKVYRYSTTKPHKLSLGMGKVLNEYAFNEVFGVK